MAVAIVGLFCYNEDYGQAQLVVAWVSTSLLNGGIATPRAMLIIAVVRVPVK